MSSDLELDIHNYNLNDLMQLFEIHSQDLSEIHKKYALKKQKLNSIPNQKLKQKLSLFFTDAYNKLIDEINKTKISQNHDLIKVKEPKINDTFQIKYPLGNINPVKRKTISQIFTIDSLFRDLTLYPESSDFIYNLPSDIENVISMRLISAEIPNVQYVFSTRRKNNKLVIHLLNGKEPEKDANGNETGNLIDFPPTGKKLEIIITDGSPSFTDLVGMIQSIINNQRNSFSLLQVGINGVTGRFFFRFKTLLECNAWNNVYYKPNNGATRMPPDNKPSTTVFKMPSVLTIGNEQHDYLKRVYLGSIEANARNIPSSSDPTSNSLISPKPLTYQVNFNPLEQKFTRSLGWLLGFRNREWMDTKLYNDVHNKSNFNCNNPKSKEYNISPEITFDNTFLTDGILFNGYLRANTAYGDNEQDYLYLYVDDFVGNYNDSINAALYDSYLAKSLLARIQIKTPFYMVEFVDNQNSTSILEKERIYFGPVNIKKLHIKLIDKYGNLVHLGNSNYSLTFLFEKLYSNIRN